MSYKHLFFFFSFSFFIPLHLATVSAAGAQEEYDKIHPVVQLKTYAMKHGMYPEIQALGTASIISEDGKIITNNHVIDDGNGYIQDGIAVCYTTDINKETICRRTAQVISRDPEKDIALLQISPQDIFGQNIAFEKLATLLIDSDYNGTIDDDVTAVGYPGIGASTITQTAGIIAGTQQRNNAVYLKTDALIAGGNSGGPLIHKGQIVGVNTFVSGQGDSLGYALASKDIDIFLSGITGTRETDISSSFRSFLRELYKAEETGEIQDDFFSLRIPEQYEVMGYIQGNSLIFNKSIPDRGDIGSVMIDSRQTPLLSSVEEFHYYAQQEGLYHPQSHKLAELTIGNKTFYQVINHNDPSQGVASEYKRYIGQLDERHYMTILLITDGAGDESLFDTIKENTEKMLNQIDFHIKKDSRLQKRQHLLSPSLSFVSGKHGSKPGRRSGGYFDSPYDRRIYLGSLHEHLSLRTSLFNREKGKGKSIEELLATATENKTTNDKQVINYYGYDGYLYCVENDKQVRTLRGEERSLHICQSVIVLPGDDEKEYLLEVRLEAESSHYETLKSLYSYYLEHGIKLDNKLTETTNSSQYLRSTTLPFQDLKGQTRDFKKSLQWLLEYNIVEEKKFLDGDRAVMWGEFIDQYLRVIYGDAFVEQKSSIKNRVQENLAIDLLSTIRTDTVDLFHKTLQAQLAGVDESFLTTEKITKLYEYGDAIYADEYRLLQNFKNKLYGKRKISLGETTTKGYFLSSQQQWQTERGIMSFPYYAEGRPYFNGKALQYNNSIFKQYIAPQCPECKEENSYKVLRYGDMINFFIEHLDAAQFDNSLREKKEKSDRRFSL